MMATFEKVLQAHGYPLVPVECYEQTHGPGDTITLRVMQKESAPLYFSYSRSETVGSFFVQSGNWTYVETRMGRMYLVHGDAKELALILGGTLNHCASVAHG